MDSVLKSLSNAVPRTTLGQRFISLLQKRVHEHSIALVSGQIDNFESYKYTVGYIQGIVDALKDFEDAENLRD